MKKVWYNYWNPPYDVSSDPAFHDDDFVWKKRIEDRWEELSAELWSLIERYNGSLVSHYSTFLYTGEGGWQNLGLMTWGKEEENLKYCPVLKSLIAEIPGFSNASINLLQAGSEIKKHQGDTNAIYRCHIGMEVPEGLPSCGFEVREEKRAWSVGKVFVFTDAHEHWAWNYTPQRRIIFLFDVIREEYLEKSFWIKLNVRAFLLMQWCVGWLMRHTSITMERILGLPKSLQRVCFYLLRCVLFLAYPFQHKILK